MPSEKNGRKKMKTLLALAILIIVTFAHIPVDDGQRVFVGNNEDYNIPHTRVWFIPAENGQYGRVYFGYDNWSPQGGMNDQGLFFDFFATKPLEVKLSKERPKFQGPIIDTMAAKCATVEEVLELFSRYNLEFMLKFQMFIVDKTGDAAIIEGGQIIRKSGLYQVVTNFHQSKVEENRRPCEWYKPSCTKYKIAETMLTEHSTASVAHFRDILEATHRNTLGARTLYSNIYDLKKGLVYLYYMHNFDKEVIIDLTEELKKGCHYYELPSLFGRELKYSRKTYTHPDPAFTISYPKHFKVTKPAKDEVLRVKCPLSSTPLFSVVVKDMPQGIGLQDIGSRHFTDELKKLGTKVRLVSTTQTELSDRTAANEMQFEWVANDIWPLKTMIVATYRGDKLIFPIVTSFAHPESLRDFLYSLRFD
jgi:hypothetical protein